VGKTTDEATKKLMVLKDGQRLHIFLLSIHNNIKGDSVVSAVESSITNKEHLILAVKPKRRNEKNEDFIRIIAGCVSSVVGTLY
jgi:hypothetical protein